MTARQTADWPDIRFVNGVVARTGNAESLDRFRTQGEGCGWCTNPILWGASTGFRHRSVPRSRNGQALVCRSTRSSAIEGEVRWGTTSTVTRRGHRGHRGQGITQKQEALR